LSLSLGNIHSCAVRTQGTVACWGTDEMGKASPP
jgi:alpha-tubulin suppressor-like RCC1 family protein